MRVVERLIGYELLERSSVVANCAMNRERRLSGRDGYSRVLGVDILARSGWTHRGFRQRSAERRTGV
jgi:hypothetical protein